MPPAMSELVENTASATFSAGAPSVAVSWFCVAGKVPSSRCTSTPGPGGGGVWSRYQSGAASCTVVDVPSPNSSVQSKNPPPLLMLNSTPTCVSGPIPLFSEARFVRCGEDWSRFVSHVGTVPRLSPFAAASQSRGVPGPVFPRCTMSSWPAAFTIWYGMKSVPEGVPALIAPAVPVAWNPRSDIDRYPLGASGCPFSPVCTIPFQLYPSAIGRSLCATAAGSIVRSKFPVPAALPATRIRYVTPLVAFHWIRDASPHALSLHAMAAPPQLV